MTLKGRDLISIHDLTREEIWEILELGKKMHDAEKSSWRHNWKDILQNKVLASLFYESSTRTRQSFETAMKELGGTVSGFSGTEGTSISKGETIRDTVMMYFANHSDVIVMRHPRDGSLQWAADVAHIPVINGGDGKNEHPTQALLDMLTMYVVREGRMDGLRIGLGGDLVHGRTIGSLTRALCHFNNIEVHWAADDRLGLPPHLEGILKKRNVSVVRHTTVREVLEAVDVYYMTRPQMERMNGVSKEEVLQILEKYRITPGLLEGITAHIMHPLPIDSRLQEIRPEVAFLPNQLYYLQAEMGIFARKALLKLLLSREGLSDYTIYSGKLPDELAKGNNLLVRKAGQQDKQQGIIHSIRRGIVIDHLPGSANDADMEAILHLRAHPEVNVVAGGHFKNPITGEWKYVFKTDLDSVQYEEIRRIALAYPTATFNVIKDGRVAEKFIAVLCENENCITRVPEEAVPPKLYNDNDQPYCRYCRHPVQIPGTKTTTKERESFIASLPIRIEPVVYK